MSCNTVADVIDTLRCEIEDPDGDIWGDDLLADMIMQAYTHIAALFASEFSEPMEVTLEPGTCLQSVCECQELLEVISIDGNDCTPPEEVSDDNLNFLNTYFPDEEMCLDGEEIYNPGWERVDCGGCSAFRLTKAPPEDREVKAIICCARTPDFCTDDYTKIELNDALFGKFYEGFKHLVLSKIYAVDRKAEDLLTLSKLHFEYWEDFRDWMMRTMFARHEKDWYLYHQKTS